MDFLTEHCPTYSLQLFHLSQIEEEGAIGFGYPVFIGDPKYYVRDSTNPSGYKPRKGKEVYVKKYFKFLGVITPESDPFFTVVIKPDDWLIVDENKEVYGVSDAVFKKDYKILSSS